MTMEKTYHFNNSTVTIKWGSVLQSSASVIVSSDDTAITMSGGVSKAILNAGGEIIQTDAQKQLPAQVGNVVVSTAGSLPQKYVFHCLTIDEKVRFEVYAKKITTPEEVFKYIISNAINKCFRLLQALDLNSIAFPMIGTGNAHLPFAQVSELMAKSFADRLSETNKRIDVELYVYDQNPNLLATDYISMFESFASSAAVLRYKNEENSYDKSFCKSSTKRTKAGKSKNYDVFISYSRKDTEAANCIYEILKAKSIKVWIDKEGISCGENYKDRIVDAIDNSKTVVFLSSENSNSSDYVVREIEYAVNMKKPVAIVSLDDAQLAKSLRYDLSNINHLNYKDSDFEEQLLTGIAFFLDKNETE